MKKVLFMMSTLLFIGMFCACSNSDDLSDVFEGQSPKENSENENGHEDYALIQGTNDDSVDFQLQNEDGIECYNFNEGDNIIFRLEIKNDTDKDVIMPRFYRIIGFDAFRVYSINGENKGTPWDEIVTNYRMHDFMEAHSSEVFLCPWFDIPALYWNGHEHYYSDMYYKKDEKLPLPKGDYYSRFYINLNDKTIICNRNFNIK